MTRAGACLRARRRRPFPRRDRRGLAALLLMALLSTVAVSVALLWQAGLAGERLRGHARHLAEAVAAEGYGLHHWLHAERTGGTLATPPPEGQARTLTNAERASLAAHSAIAPWRRDRTDATRPIVPRGWEVVHLVGRAGDHPDGVLVLRPSAAVVALPTWEAAGQALDLVLGARADDAAALATFALAASPLDNYDADRDRAVLASRFARLDTDAVLREVHAGHAAATMETGILMGGNDVADADLLEGRTGVIPVIDGRCADGPRPNTLCAESFDLGSTLTASAGTTLSAAAADDVTLAGAVTGIDRIRTLEAVVNGPVRTPVLTACADPDADLCGGGDLDILAGTGTPRWTEAAIFGDTVIRNGNRLVGVTQTTAAQGVFGTVTGALTVLGCMRSVNPFRHFGGGC